MRADDSAVLVTGGAGFIGRWVVRDLLFSRDPSPGVVILDNCSNGSRENVAEFEDHPGLLEFVEGDIVDSDLTARLFDRYRFETVFHLAARINVQESIDDPASVFEADVAGTFNLLERARKAKARFVFTSTCMVYDACADESGISEEHPVKPASPYAGAKLAAENMILGHHFAFGLPVAILRPFNTYGPFQKSTGEGGVVAIFSKAVLNGRDLTVFGDGTQTRDLLYATDCARFIVKAGFHPACAGRVLNGGFGRDVSVNALASLICGDASRIRHVEHIHPQSEIKKLKCDRRLAEKLIGWSPEVTLPEGLRKTSEWIASHLGENNG